jgi:DNA-binding NarL/FixJ family response regulator
MFNPFKKLNMKELAERQLQTLQSLSDGLSVEEIAAEHHRSVQTIREHMKMAKARLNAK